MNRRELFVGLAALSVTSVPVKAAPLHPVSLDTARFELEHLYKVKAGIPGPWAQTGEKYISICTGGIKEEGAPYPFWTASEQKAIESWLEHAIKYSLSKMTTPYHYSSASTLYWRQTPELIKVITEEDITFYTVYSRLLISNEPDTWQFIENYLPTRTG